MVWPLDLNEPDKALSTMIVRENFYDQELAHKAALKLTEKISDRERAAELVERLFAAITALHRQSRRDDQPLHRLQPFIDRTFAVFDAILEAGGDASTSARSDERARHAIVEFAYGRPAD